MSRVLLIRSMGSSTKHTLPEIQKIITSFFTQVYNLP